MKSKILRTASRDYLALIVTLVLTTLWCTRTEAQRPNYSWSFSPAYAAWRNFPEPVIDGNIDSAFPGDIGWSSAFKYVFNNGTGVPDVVVLARAKDDYIDLGVQVKNDPSWDLTDTIVIAFGWKSSPGTGPPDTFARIHVQPLLAGGVNMNPLSTYWTGTGGNNAVTWANQQNNVTWLEQATTTGGNPNPGGNKTWDTEIRMHLGTTKLPVPKQQPLSFYFNLVRAESGSSLPLGATEFPWPSDKAGRTALTDPGIIKISIQNTPAPQDWGKGIIDSTANCFGINFSQSDISSVPQYLIANQAATLKAVLHNNMVDGQSGVGKAANKVDVTFFKAPYGMSGFNNWSQLGLITLSTIPYDGPGLGGAPGTVAQIPWTPTTADLLGGMAGHNCIRVQLSSTEEATAFVNQGEFNNMWVHLTSKFISEPVLQVKGLPKPPGGGNTRRIHIDVTKSPQFAYADAKLPNIRPGTLTAQLTCSFIGSFETELFCDVGTNRHYLNGSLASYGYVLQHPLSKATHASFEQWQGSALDLLYGAYRLRELTLAGLDQPPYTNRTQVPLPHNRAALAQADGTHAPLPEKRPTMAEIVKMEPALRDLWISRINTLLNELPAKPPTSLWRLALPAAFKPVPERTGSYVVDVPVEGEIRLPTSFETTGTPPLVPPCHCRFCATTSGIGALVMMVGMAGLGLVVYGSRKVEMSSSERDLC